MTSIGGDSSQDEAEEEAKAITVNACFLFYGNASECTCLRTCNCAAPGEV